MKYTKIYSFDECSNNNKVIAKLELLSEDRKIDFEFIDSDLVKIKDISLTAKEIKELNQFLHDNDVIEDHDLEDEDEDEDEDDTYEEDY
jgi:hypothetical protein